MTAQPVVKHEGNLWQIEPVDPDRIAFTWDPVRTHEMIDLIEVARIQTEHSYGAPVFFKPSISEVLNQIPEELDDITAFQTFIDDRHISLQFNADSSKHVATTILYTGGTVKPPEPYLIQTVVTETEYRTQNSDYPENALCVCGHEYHRHFNPMDTDIYNDPTMEDAGCKYDHCRDFVAAPEGAVAKWLQYEQEVKDVAEINEYRTEQGWSLFPEPVSPA